MDSPFLFYHGVPRVKIKKMLTNDIYMLYNVNKATQEQLLGGENVYNVLDISRFIINYCDKKDYSLSNLKLQKILYFVQAYYVSYTESQNPCFKENIEAWDFGPVVPVAYHEYKRFGSASIPKVTTYIEFDPNDFWNSKLVEYDDSVISIKDKNIIELLVDKFSQYSTTTLVRITHDQSPWINAHAQGNNNVISIEAIRSYFNGK